MSQDSRFEDTSTPVSHSHARSAHGSRAASVAGDTLNDVIKDPAKRAKLISDNNLLKGVIMTRDGPVASGRQLVEEPVNLNASVDTVATIDTTTVETEFTDKLMQKNYNSASVKASVPYVTANAEYSNESTYKNTENEKTILVSSRYLFRQGRIDFSPPDSGFDDAVKLSSGFLSAINGGLSKSSPADQREALHKVFEEYGHIFRTRIQIGGVLSGHTMDVFKRSENEKEVKQDVKAGLEATVKEWGGGGASAGHGNTESSIKTKQGRTLTVKYIVNGGDYTKIQDVAQWIATTDKPEYWRDIEVSAAVPVVEMLPKSIREKVRDLMKPLLGKWVDVEKVDNIGQLPKAVYKPKGAIPDGWYWLGYTADSERTLLVKPTLPSRSGRNPATTTGRQGSGLTTQPFPNLPQYAFLTTYFEEFTNNAAPSTQLAALRPDLFEEGRWDLTGDSIATSLYITRPNPPSDPADEVFDSQPIIRVKLPGSSNPPRPRWLLKKNVVLIES